MASPDGVGTVRVIRGAETAVLDTTCSTLTVTGAEGKRKFDYCCVLACNLTTLHP